VPGQVISGDMLAFMDRLETREVHGYLAGFGYRLFTASALQ
jgi:arginine decarboxylase